MRKIFTILLLMVVMCISTGGCSASTIQEMDINNNEIELLYNDEIDYMALMIQYAADGNVDMLEHANEARNEKISDKGLGFETITVEQFFNNYEDYAGFSLNKDYLGEMITCCLIGDAQNGVEAERMRNLKIDTLNLSLEKISFNDLFQLSKIITAEAGSNWLPMEWKMMVGEVLLNRIDSVEFPNTIDECIYQKGQYYSKNSYYFANLLPYEDCVKAAARLLNGERLINDGSVVFQANFPQGSGTYLKLYDKKLGHTYLCHSNYPEKYER